MIGLVAQPRLAEGAVAVRARIACTGLDVLHRVRLKVAVSLLMADFIQADLVDDDGRPVDLLVGDADDAHAQQRLLEVAGQGGAVLAISRLANDGVPARLAQGASVREIHQQLVLLLGGLARPTPVSATQPGVLAGRTLFHWLARSPGQACLLHNGLVKLLLDAERGQVHLLRDLPLEHYAQQAVSEGWSCEVLDTEAFSRAKADAVDHCSWERFCWQAAALVDTPLPAVDRPGALRLQGWPDMPIEQLPATWLLPLACLLQRSWILQQLARQPGIDGGDVQRIAAAACWAGMVCRDAAVAAAPVPAAAPGGLFARIARRFGLALTSLQVQH